MRRWREHLGRRRHRTPTRGEYDGPCRPRSSCRRWRMERRRSRSASARTDDGKRARRLRWALTGRQGTPTVLLRSRFSRSGYTTTMCAAQTASTGLRSQRHSAQRSTLHFAISDGISEMLRLTGLCRMVNDCDGSLAVPAHFPHTTQHSNSETAGRCSHSALSEDTQLRMRWNHDMPSLATGNNRCTPDPSTDTPASFATAASTSDDSALSSVHTL